MGAPSTDDAPPPAAAGEAVSSPPFRRVAEKSTRVECSTRPFRASAFSQARPDNSLTAFLPRSGTAALRMGSRVSSNTWGWNTCSSSSKKRWRQGGDKGGGRVEGATVLSLCLCFGRSARGLFGESARHPPGGCECERKAREKTADGTLKSLHPPAHRVAGKLPLHLTRRWPAWSLKARRTCRCERR